MQKAPLELDAFDVWCYSVVFSSEMGVAKFHGRHRKRSSDNKFAFYTSNVDRPVSCHDRSKTDKHIYACFRDDEGTPERPTLV